MFKIRLVSGIGLLLLAFLAVFLGGYFFSVVIFILSITGMYELLKTKDMQKTEIAYLLYLLNFFYYLLVIIKFEIPIYAFIIAVLTLLSSYYVVRFPKFNFDQVIFAFFVFIYTGLLISFMIHTRNMNNGKWLIWLTFISSWGCDTCAYCFGMLFGKKKLTKILSPKKTVEGAIGGITGAVIISLIFTVFIVKHTSISSDAFYKIPLITLVGAVLSEIGDLLASGIKRDSSIKDFGNIIPGHGGILDRFDSVIFISPVIYILSHYLL